MKAWWDWFRVRSHAPVPRTHSRPMTIEDTARWRDDIERRVTYVEAILSIYTRDRGVPRAGGGRASPPPEGDR